MENYYIMVVLLVVPAFVLIVGFEQILAGTILLCIAFWLSGWVFAHNTIATECERLGKFYVGDTTYECTKVEKK